MKKNALLREFSQKYPLELRTLEPVLLFVLWCSREQYLFIEEVDDVFIPKVGDICEKLAQWYPIEYITWKANFYGFDFIVNEHTLIPRNDTEVLVDTAIWYASQFLKNFYYFDIGTGTGCIPLTLYSQVKDMIQKGFLFEISAETLQVAKQNKERLFPEAPFDFICDDFHTLESSFQDLKIEGNMPLVITANLPYIKVWDENLSQNVSQYEPNRALFWGEETGFELYEDLFEIFLILQKKYEFDMVFFIEIGSEQRQVATEFLEKKSLKFEFFRDTWNRDRVIQVIIPFKNL